jgi:hypothetical protein
MNKTRVGRVVQNEFKYLGFMCKDELAVGVLYVNDDMVRSWIIFCTVMLSFNDFISLLYANIFSISFAG